MRSSMDGSNRKTLLGGVGRASGLTIDYAARKLYWASAAPSIETANLDGTNAHTLISSGLTKPSSLAYFQVGTDLSTQFQLYLRNIYV